MGGLAYVDTPYVYGDTNIPNDTCFIIMYAPGRAGGVSAVGS